ncbi:hypothetical protein DV702_10410 [Sporosarcina sp. PTS2304]|uniref:hypothetical protein n=1 Tax=Sporosarcina sp. PTS2304 TaxID=2283194 RepID=UPI000E0DAFBE|nr:hypothetical protein [Sporosarcina sp. PTS2304]AXI00091.1 hypothetical protein DV702_10410 [Sporosarcina sp. PTS2304]
MEMDNTTAENQKIATKESFDITQLTHEVEDLRREVKQLREDLEFVSAFQKKPIVTVDIVKVVGSYIIGALVIIGIFF